MTQSDSETKNDQLEKPKNDAVEQTRRTRQGTFALVIGFGLCLWLWTYMFEGLKSPFFLGSTLYPLRVLTHDLFARTLIWVSVLVGLYLIIAFASTRGSIRATFVSVLLLFIGGALLLLTFLTFRTSFMRTHSTVFYHDRIYRLISEGGPQCDDPSQVLECDVQGLMCHHYALPDLNAGDLPTRAERALLTLVIDPSSDSLKVMLNEVKFPLIIPETEFKGRRCVW